MEAKLSRIWFAAEPADATPPKRFQKKESPFKVTDLWAEVQKLLEFAVYMVLNFTCMYFDLPSDIGNFEFVSKRMSADMVVKIL